MAKPKIYQQLSINCASCAYPIYIGDNLLSYHDLLRRHVLGKQVMIVTNDKLSPLYLQNLKQAFADIQCDEIILGDGEINKSQQNLTNIYNALIQGAHHRDTTLIALGGGVIGDITGFAAATYQRGVDFIQLPTTLLAQVDASIGGKTAINHPEGKNMIGSFHQPSAVIMDIGTLSTLPEREFRSGFAEIIKYGLLVGGDLLSNVNNQLDEGISVNSKDKLSSLIAASCNIKALFVVERIKKFSERRKI
jgi:3-dehydroquinate synthase